MQSILQTGPYIPRRDLALRDWLNNFAQKTSETPFAYGLQPGDAAAIQSAANAFDSALRIATEPQTRTSVSIAAKDGARASAIATCRTYAGLIKANKGVGTEQLLAVGLRPDDLTRMRISPPTSAPMLSILGAFNASHVLRYCDTSSPTSKAKPPGTARLDLYVAVGPTRASNAEEAKYVGGYTRAQFEVTFSSKEGGQTATYFGRWATRRGLTGPWSLPASMIIATGGGQAQAEMKLAA